MFAGCNANGSMCIWIRMCMEMANTKKKPEYGDRLHNGNGRSDRYKKIGFLGNILMVGNGNIEYSYLSWIFWRTANHKLLEISGRWIMKLRVAAFLSFGCRFCSLTEEKSLLKISMNGSLYCVFYFKALSTKEFILTFMEFSYGLHFNIFLQL